ncbi:hypothetical protein [Chryseobacterium sp. MMS23-Vi53]|uniref:hypothetical protein n=1 Tax=Chryseobacterium sp. MMS23-Vi53 TaxID=3386644 RepID=UPI0039EB07EA
MKLKQHLFLTVLVSANFFYAQTGNVGIGTNNPGTKLDVNGGITNRETQVTVSGNAVTIPSNTSQVQLEGTSTADIVITAPTPPNAGQRLVIYNNTTSGFNAVLNGVIIPNNTALEFVYSNANWRATDGGAVAIAEEALNRNYYGWLKTGDAQVLDPADITGNIYHLNGNVGIGKTTPTARLDIAGDGTTQPVRMTNLLYSNVTTNIPAITRTTITPVFIDNNGVVAMQYSPIIQANSFAFTGLVSGLAGSSTTFVSGIGAGTIVTFKFATNLAFGENDSGILYGQISYSQRRGFQVAGDWNYSDSSATSNVNITGLGTNTLTFVSNLYPDLIFSYSGGNISVGKSNEASTTGFSVQIYDCKKIR